MENFEIVNKLKNNFKYCLEYDYYLQSSSDVELVDLNGTVYILNPEEKYCMITDFCRDELNNVDDIIRKKFGCDKVLINFNLGQNAYEDIELLKENKYEFNSAYDSYIFDKNRNFEDNSADDEHIVELTSQNISRYTYDDCNQKIRYRPSFERLVDVFLNKNNGKIIAYVKDGCILGYLSYVNIFEGVNDIDYIYVADKYRKLGIGTLLGKHYAKISKKEDKSALWGNATEISSKTAIKSGFEWCCKHVSFYKEMDN